MNQFYWVENGDKSNENSSTFSSIPVEGYPYTQEEIYCIEFMELEDPIIDELKDANNAIVSGNYVLENNDLIILRLIDKENSENYQDIFYGTFLELKEQKYLTFSPYITFEHGDILIINITNESNDILGYFPFQNLVISHTEEGITQILEGTYAQHYYIIDNEKYYGFNIFKVVNWITTGDTISIKSIDKTNDTNFYLVVNNQVYNQDNSEFDNILSFPEKINFFAILDANGIITSQETGDVIDNTCIIINYE